MLESFINKLSKQPPSILILLQRFNHTIFLMSCIIIKQQVPHILSASMENYQLFQNFLQKYTNFPFNQFFYASFMFYNQCSYYFPQSTYEFPKTQTQKVNQSVHTSQIDITKNQNLITNSERNETPDSFKLNEQKSINSSPQDEKIQHITISNRNILPNNLNLLLSYIRRINKSGKAVGKILKSLNKGQAYTTKKFYAYQAYLKQQIPFHKSQNTIKNITSFLDPHSTIFSLEEQKIYNKVCRILISYFLRGSYLPTLLTSRRILKTSKADHLKIRRMMMLILKGASSEELSVFKVIQQ